jgi:hypothetical protein
MVAGATRLELATSGVTGQGTEIVINIKYQYYKDIRWLSKKEIRIK